MERESFVELQKAKRRHWRHLVFRYGNNTLDHIDFDLRWDYSPLVKRKRKSYLMRHTYRKEVKHYAI